MRSAVRFCLCVLIAAFCGVAAHSQSSQAATTSEKPANPLEMKAPGPGEEKAYKTFQKFQAMPESDGAKKTQAAEDFLNKFPTSSYASYVYSYLTVAYIQTGQIDKGLATGEKDLQVNPSDFRTMSVLSQTISRTVDDSTPDASTKLDKAQTYAKNAIAGAGTWVKPDPMSDEHFTTLKNETLAMTHSSLGLVAIHKNNFEGAIPELEQAVQLGSNTDPTNYYLLGLANQNAGHSDKAISALEKCAGVKGTNVTPACISLLDQAKADAAKAHPK